jgi:hypothetical protein
MISSMWSSYAAAGLSLPPMDQVSEMLGIPSAPEAPPADAQTAG